MFKDTFWVAMGQVLNIMLAMVLSAILARLLSKDGLGRYQLVLSYVAIGSILALPGMSTTIYKSVLKRAEWYYRIAVKRCLLSSSLGSFLVICVGILVQQHVRHDIGISLIFAGAFLPVLGLYQYDNYYLGRQLFRRSRMMVVLQAASNLLLVGTVAWLQASPWWCLIALLISRLGFALGNMRATLSMVDETQELDVDVKESLLKQAWSLSGIAAFSLVITQLDRVILGNMDIGILAIYHVGSILPLAIKNNMKTLLTVPVTAWSKLEKREHLLKIKKWFWRLGLMGVGLSLLSWWVAGWLIPLLYGEEYTTAVPVARWLSLGIAPLLLAAVIRAVSVYQERAGFSQSVEVVRHVVFVVALLMAIPKWGLMGVVGAILLRETTVFAMSAVYLVIRVREVEAEI